jgi:hypothetical protein
MIVDEGPSYKDMANGAAPWVTLGSACVAVFSFFILLGMWLGPQKDVPAQLTEVRALLNEMKGRLDKTDWRLDALQNQANGIGMQVSVAIEDKSKLWNEFRDLKTNFDKLESISITREAFLEWKSEFEARTRTTTPQLRKNN